MKSQEVEIINGIHQFVKECEDFSDKPILKNINVELLAKLLNNPEMWKSGSDMKAIMCLIHNIIANSSDDMHNDGVNIPNKGIREWINKLAKLGVNSVEGFVYNVELIDPQISVILKVPQDTTGIPDILREYYVGTKYINTLRYTIPNFMYTLGAFYCNSPSYSGNFSVSSMCSGNVKNSSPYVVYEKIPGYSMKSMIINKKLDYNGWLDIFSQLLIALEIAQRKLNYSHFDLHTGNLMIREVKEGLTYSVNLDGETITFKNKRYVPVIIDFGMSTVTDPQTQNVVGSYDYAQYGMMHFMVPAFDMYKFMHFSALVSKGDMFKKICSLFKFFPDDPYNIANDGPGKIYPAYNIGKLTFSKNAWYTPLMMFKYINNYGATISKRETSYIVNYDSSLYKYYSILNMSDDAIKSIDDMINLCINMEDNYSYIKMAIFISILDKYSSSNLKDNGELFDKIKFLKNKVLEGESKEKDDYIKIDNAILAKVFKVEIPSQNQLDTRMNQILDTTLQKGKADRIKTKALILKLDTFSSFFESVSKYLLMYYTILELDIQKYYGEWMGTFMSSEQKKFYSKNIVRYRDTVRWTNSLNEYIK